MHGSSVFTVYWRQSEYTIDRGVSRVEALEFDYVTIHVKYPGVRPLLPDIPSLGIPNPVAEGYLEEYLPYLMTARRNRVKITPMDSSLEKQIEKSSACTKEDGYGTNQAFMTVGEPIPSI